MPRPGELAVVVLALLCCAVPLLVASGIAGVAAGYALKWWPALVVGVGLLAVAIAVRLRRRRGRPVSRDNCSGTVGR